ncbi:MAG: 4-hydroxy-2-oxovalerate aldolase [Patescibacteria group bacterium]
MKTVTLLETTIRDGSYEIDFSFTSSDVRLICRRLEDAGVEYIEIGHGVGLHASESGFGRAIQSDEEYMIAAEQVLTKATYGMFCIPGIARLEDLDLAKRHGMGFVRIGTNVSDVPASEPFIRTAKRHGMFVAANYMKSYAVSPEEFARNVKLSEGYGADMVYIVDSAGGMFAEDIERYFKAIRAVSDIPVGFHAHDNLGLAVSNSIAAADMGIQFVDASLQGLGRSAGNAVTEILVAALLKRGYHMDLDILKLFEIGQDYIQPLLRVRGRMPLDITSGFAEFHSSYMPHIQACAAKFNVNPILLIIEMCKIDKVNLDVAKLEDIAKRMQGGEEIYFGKFGFDRYVGGEQERPA